MQHRPTTFIAVGIPIYVAGSFVASILGPFWSHLEAADPPEPVTLAFVGDMMFDRYVRERADRMGYDAILADAVPAFGSSTVRLGNLEGPITTFAPVSDYRVANANHYRFTFATTTAALLARYGFSAVSLGNNHALNFGGEGLAQTKDWLTRAGVGYLGAPDEPYTPWRLATNGRQIAVYGYDLWNANDVATLSDRITREPSDTFVVVMAHWGDEYAEQPNAQQIAVAHRLVDAGADLIIGSHPHVIEPKEEYRGAWIYYSLGNFVFDQYFSAEVRCGAVVRVTLVPKSTSTVFAESFVSLESNGTTAASECASKVPALAKGE